MNPVSFDIMTLLSDNAFGVISTDLFAMGWGEGIDSQILIMDVAGGDSPLKEVYENPHFQIIVRGEKNADFLTAYGRIKSIHEFLISLPTGAINGTDYLEFEPFSTIAALGRDDNDRAIFSMNYYTFRDPI